MGKQSAGILVYKIIDGKLQVLIVHPGGPFWGKKDLGVWSIPKGEFQDEDAFTAAKREFNEETGFVADGNFIQLSSQKLKSGKTIHAWAVEGSFPVENFVSNTFKMEWPPKSGKQATFSEIDKAAWVDIETALIKLNDGQTGFIRELVEKLQFPIDSSV